MSAVIYVLIFMLLILWENNGLWKYGCVCLRPQGRGQKKQVLQEKWEDISTREFSLLSISTKGRCFNWKPWPGTHTKRVSFHLTENWWERCWSRIPSFPYSLWEGPMATHSSTLSGKSCGWKSLVGYSPWVAKSQHDWATSPILDTGDGVQTDPTLLSCPLQTP